MGATESTKIDDKLFGFRVYEIADGSPIHSAGVKELEDFIIPPEEVFANKIPFYEYINNNTGNKIELSIYSLLKRHFYTIQISPNVDWSPNKEQGNLGASVKYENWSTANRCLLRVVKVKLSSPAHKKLGLTAGEDFIIAVRSENGEILTLNKDFTDPLTIFTNYLTLYINKNLEFFIYNCKKGSRHLNILLEDEPLGCDVAYGKLHEFPRLNHITEAKKEVELSPKIVKLDNLDNRLNSVDNKSEEYEKQNIRQDSNIKNDRTVTEQSTPNQENLDNKNDEIFNPEVCNKIYNKNEHLFD
jgi:hypothetical protein